MKPQILFSLAPDAFEKIYGGGVASDLVALGEPARPANLDPAELRNMPELLEGVAVLCTGWGGPRLDETLLEHARDLTLVLYGAGSIAPVVTQGVYERGIRVASAWRANAVPVSEWTLGTILLALKQFWQHSTAIRLEGPAGWHVQSPIPGAYASTVGLIGLGAIGRLVAEWLAHFDVEVIAFDPGVDAAGAEGMGVRLVDLQTCFEQADVVSLHVPWTAKTDSMIRGEHIRSMKQRTTLVNTSRGGVINEREMVEVLRARPDIHAVLDVTHPEPPEPGSMLYELQNVHLTPHIAGSIDGECRRMGRLMIDELRRFLSGESLQHEVTREMYSRAAVLG